MTSLVAVLSVAGLALSLAVQNFLSNVAGGLQLLVSQPFKVGDYVEAGGCSGTVAEIGMSDTKLNSVDNKLVQLPNSTIVSQNILNYSSEESRRVELKVSASYNAATEQVKAVLARLVGEHPLILSEPDRRFMSTVMETAPSSMSCGSGVKMRITGQSITNLMDRIKPAFDQTGIEMTYPHVNVHMMER